MLISFILVEYYCIDDIFTCISSIQSSINEFITYEIIISSNSLYSKETQRLLINRDLNIKWSFNHKNGGFGYAMNRGMELAKGKYLIISNPDVIIERGMADILTFMEKYKNIGIVGPQIVDNQGLIQDSCRPYVTPINYLSRHIRRIISRKESILENNLDYSSIQTVDWIIGAFMVIRADCFHKTKGFDENYFLYAEDIDFCTRVRLIGYEIVYFPKTIIRYKGTRSARYSFKSMRFFINSHIRYWLKFGGGWNVPRRKTIIFTD